MKRFLLVLVGAVVLLGECLVVEPSSARRVVVRRGGGPRHRRTVVVVHRGWPIRRRMPNVVIHTRPGIVYRVGAPTVFLAPIAWTAAVATMPSEPERLVWEDNEVISQDDDWTEFTLNCDSQGDALFMDVDGNVQLNFAEVVFGNGDAQVVDFNEKSYKSGLYSLLNFKDGRKVDHVRMVTKSKDGDSKIALRMLK